MARHHLLGRAFDSRCANQRDLVLAVLVQEDGSHLQQVHLVHEHERRSGDLVARHEGGRHRRRRVLHPYLLNPSRTEYPLARRARPARDGRPAPSDPVHIACSETSAIGVRSSPDPRRFGASTRCPAPSRSGTNFSQDQPPTNPPCTNTNLPITGLLYYFSASCSAISDDCLLDYTPTWGGRKARYERAAEGLGDLQGRCERRYLWAGNPITTARCPCPSRSKRRRFLLPAYWASGE